MTRLINGIALGVAVTSVALIAARPVHSQSLPTDAQPLCAIAPTTFAQMFASGSVTLNGVVNPADSRKQLGNNCAFFGWSEQMFLWMTSPAPSSYGGGSRVMFSPTFYTVSPAFQDGVDPSGKPIMRRKFLRNVPGAPIRMDLRASELGPNMLPATLTRTGQLVEVERPVPAKPVPPQVRTSAGALVPLSSVTRAPTGELKFFSAGKPITVRKVTGPTIARTMVKTPEGKTLSVVPRAEAATAIRARKFVINGVPVLIDPANNVIDVETGQAGDNSVLLTQNGSLIYYITAVNDVFAFSRTMRGAAPIPKTTTLTMPTTGADANTIAAFAASKGTTIVDREALAIESKSSWVEASSVPDPQNYISTKAILPVYVQSTVGGVTTWTPQPGKTRTATLVMVGMHVVGSTLGHGEMVWGSFERFGNAPNASYQYQAASGVKTVPQNTLGQWTFAPNNASAPFNLATGTSNPDGSISGSPGIGPSSVLRMHAFGSLATDALLNTQVISATGSVRNMLIPGDVRRYYYQIGTTWTMKGAAPNSSNQIGTNLMANATLETFMQASTGSNGTNCFSCHTTNKTSVSHSYNMLIPLF